MRKNFGAKTWCYPMPVLILAAYDENNVPDAMNAAWGGICGDNEIAVNISAGHKTTDNIRKAGVFTISMGDAAHMTECDYLGVVSAHKVPDKVESAGLHTYPSAELKAPVIEELPMTLECRLKSYDPDTGMLFADIVNVMADERILDDEGNIDPEKFEPITFDPVACAYRKLGETVGKAFHDGKKLKEK